MSGADVLVDEACRAMRYRVTAIRQNGLPILLAEGATVERVGKICADPRYATAFKAIRIEPESDVTPSASETGKLSCRETILLRRA